MTEFESRALPLFEALADEAPVQVDATALAASIATAMPRRARAFRLWGERPAWLSPVVLMALLVLAIAASVLVGALLLTHHPPIPRPLVIQPVGFMSQQRGGAVTVRLSDGRVLVIAGSNGYAGANRYFAELYDPATRAFTPTGSVDPVFGQGGTATLLPDGRVLYAGGSNEKGEALVTALLYDPRTGTFVALPDMASARTWHAAVLLPDGRVALIGGRGHDRGARDSAMEYFDSTSLSFQAGPRSQLPQLSGRRTLGFALTATRVLLLFPGLSLAGSTGALDAGALVFDTSTGSLEAATSSGNGEIQYIDEAAALNDGRIAIVVRESARGAAAGDSVIVFDPQTRRYSHVADLDGIMVARPQTLADGRVLIAEHSVAACGDVFADVFEPERGSITRIGQIGGIGGCSSQAATSITPLEDGSALIAGGYMSSGQETSSASLVHP